MTDANPFARGAPVWRAAGWAGTLWLPYGKKSPPPTDYTGALGLEPDDNTVAGWAQQPGNLGIRMPMGVIGLDVDYYKQDGPGSLSQLVHACGPLPATWRSSSRPDARSGVYLYRVPVGVKLRGNPMPAIEVIQFHHRYAVTWPSLHPDGGTYRLHSPDGMPGVMPPRVDDLPWLPEDWLKQLVEPERPAGTTVARRVTGEWSTAVMRLYHETSMALQASGGRHDAMLRGVDGLTRLDHLGHPGAREAIELLSGQFLTAVADSRTPGEALAELERMLAGAEQVVGGTSSFRPPWSEPLEPLRPHKALQGPPAAPTTAPGPFQAPTVPPSALVAPLELPDPLEGWHEADVRSYIEAGLANDVAELLQRDDGQGLLYGGKVNTLFGASGSGKTWLGLLLIAQEVRAGQRCLYLDWEDDPRTYIRRLLALGCSDEQIIAHATYISPVLPATPAVVDWLTDQGFRAAVLDSTGESIAAHGGNDNDGTDVASWMALLPRPLARAGCCVVLVDHVPHATDGPPREVGSQRKRAAISGASYSVEQVEAFSKDRPGKVLIRTGKDRGGNFARGQVVAEATFTPGDGRLAIVLEQPRWIGPDGAIRPTEIMERISTWLHAHQGATAKEIKAGVRGRDQTILQALGVLIDEGYVTAEGDPSQATPAQHHRLVKPYSVKEDPRLTSPDDLEGPNA